MSSYGTLDEVEGHSTWRCVNGDWETFWYVEPFSRHNKGKHWVDDVNNRHHDPIGLEYTWKTKWWPNRQFTFLLSVAEVNAGQAQARAKDKKPAPTLDFLTEIGAANDDEQNTGKWDCCGISAAPGARRSTLHVLTKHKKTEGKWNPYTKRFKVCKLLYIPVHAPFVGKRHDRIVHLTLEQIGVGFALESICWSMAAEII